MDLNLLGFDYGRRFIGIAVSQSGLAEPLETIATNKVVDWIKKYERDNHLDAIVIGISEGAMATETKQFAKDISKITSVSIFFHDETLSSYDTRVQVAQAGMSRHRRQGKIDHLVAATILQDFIDSYATLALVPESARMR